VGYGHACNQRTSEGRPSITAQAARAAGMNQIVVLAMIDHAQLKAVLAWHL
jgi:hypothetical protein